MGRVEIATLTIGARAKEGKGGGGGEKKNTLFSLLSPRPLPSHFHDYTLTVISWLRKLKWKQVGVYSSNERSNLVLCARNAYYLT